MRKYKKLSISMSMLWNSFGSTVYLGCQWLITVIVVYLSSDLQNAGNLSLAISISNVIYTMAVFNVRTYQISDLEKKYSSREYIGFRIITSAVSIAVCIVFLLVSNFTTHQQQCILLYVFFRTGEAVVDVFSGIQQRGDRMDYVGISFIVRGIVSLTVFILVLRANGDINISILMMCIATYIVIALYDIPRARQFDEVIPSFSRRSMRSMLLECSPLAISLVLFAFIVTFPRQALDQAYGGEMLGIYASVATPTVIVQVATAYILTPLLTSFAKLAMDKDKKGFLALVWKIVLVIAVFTVFMIFFSRLLGEWGLRLLFGERLISYSYLLPSIILCTSLSAYILLFINLMTVLRGLIHVFTANVVAFAISFLSSDYFVKNFGLMGVSYCTIVSYSACFLILIVLGTVLVKKSFA
jgi:O-antigen/teichoic acid export membrane protein